MIFDKLGRTPGANLVYSAETRWNLSEHEIDVVNSLKAYSYYKKDTNSIRNYLFNYLSMMINSATLNKMPLVTLNYIPKYIKRLTLAYKNPPIIEDANDEYIKVNRNLNRWRKEFHRQGKLFNTILVRPIYDEDEEYFDYYVLNRGLCEVATKLTNNKKMTELVYWIEIPRESGKTEKVAIHWTDESHWAENGEGKHIKLDFIPEDEKNPYGEIPFVVLRLDDSIDFFGDGMVEKVQGNEHLNARLTDSFFKLYMSFGIPFGVNLDIKAEDYYLGPDMPIMVNGVRADMQVPSLEFISPDQKVELDKEVQDWFINEMGISEGLPAGSFTEREIANSGFAKQIDSMELIDLNEDDKDALREFEFKLFEMQKLVLSTETNKKIGDKFNFEFGPIEFPKSDDEIWFNREKEFQYNISTPVDWFREDRPEATDEDIEETLAANKEINSQFKGQKAPGILDKFRSTELTNE